MHNFIMANEIMVCAGLIAFDGLKPAQCVQMEPTGLLKYAFG
jgi:hypothetical protein